MPKQFTVEDWQLAYELFEKYIDKPIPKTLQQVDSDSDISTSVKAILKRLIKAQAIESTSIDNADLSYFSTLNKMPDLSGKTIGDYLLLCQIGRGGMSHVYKAKRTTTSIQKHVALKLLSTNSQNLNESLKVLFNQEQLTLSKLNHANIISFHHGGISKDGIPYLVMEYVEDTKTIDKYCRQQKLTCNEIINLITPVASAINYAHQQLVVHKDVKPSNVLVDSQGTPYLVDFGIATITEIEGNKKGSTHKEIYTPGYASPEQVQKGIITISSDIYSFSALLLELLTEKKPLINLHEDSYDYSIIQARFYKQLSQSKIDSDLANIIKKGLSYKPNDRYQSILELKHDLQNWQSSRPVTATRSTKLYLIKKFIKRNPLSSFFVTVLLSAIVFSLLAMFSQMNIAEYEARKANQVTNFLLESIQASDPDTTKGKDVSVKEFLINARVKIQETSLQDPLLTSSLEQTIGTALAKVGEYYQAEKLLLKAIASDHNNYDARLSLAQLYLAQNLFDKTKIQMLALLKNITSLSKPQSLQLQHIEVKLLNKQGLFDDAIKIVNQAISDATKQKLIPQVIQGNIILAHILTDKSEPEKAVKTLKNTLSLSHRTFGELSTSSSQLLKLLADTLTNINPTPYQKIKDIYTEVINKQIKLYGKKHPIVAQSYLQYGFTLKATNDIENAKKYAALAQKIALGSFGKDHMLSAHVDLLISQIAFIENNIQQAISTLEQVITVYEKTFGKNHFETNQVKTTLSVYLIKAQQGEKAIEILLPLYQSQLQQLGENHQATLYVALSLCKAYSLTGNYSNAISIGKKALIRSKKFLGEEFSITVGLQATLAENYLKNQQSNLAIIELKPLLTIPVVINNSHYHKKIALLLINAYQANQQFQESIDLKNTLLSKYYQNPDDFDAIYKELIKILP